MPSVMGGIRPYAPHQVLLSLLAALYSNSGARTALRATQVPRKVVSRSSHPGVICKSYPLLSELDVGAKTWLGCLLCGEPFFSNVVYIA